MHIARMLEAFAAIGAPTTLVRPATGYARDHAVDEFVDAEIAVATLPALSRGERAPRIHALTMLGSYAAWLAAAAIRGRLQWLHVRDFRVAALAGRIARGASLALEVHHSAARAARVPGVDLFVAISHGVAGELAAAGVPAERIHVAHDAVDLSRYRDAEKLGTERRSELGLGSRFVVGYTGHLYGDRGIERLLEAIDRLDEGFAALIVGGAPSDLARVRGALGRPGRSGRVIVTGPVHPDLVPGYQAAADALVVPYGSDYAMKSVSSPLKLHEYMAAKRPIVIGDLPYAREVVDASMAVLVDPDDPAAYAQALRLLRDDPDLAGRLAASAAAAVAENSWERRALGILAAAGAPISPA